MLADAAAMRADRLLALAHPLQEGVGVRFGAEFVGELEHVNRHSCSVA